MFVRLKKSGDYKYLQIVQTYREGGKVKQRVISTLGRLEQLQEKGEIESIISSLSKYSRDVIFVLQAIVIQKVNLLLLDRFWSLSDCGGRAGYIVLSTIFLKEGNLNLMLKEPYL
jgi:hypothetical protein